MKLKGNDEDCDCDTDGNSIETIVDPLTKVVVAYTREQEQCHVEHERSSTISPYIAVKSILSPTNITSEVCGSPGKENNSSAQ
jgi:hypothetical protein